MVVGTRPYGGKQPRSARGAPLNYWRVEINFDQKFTSAYSASKVSPGIGLDPDDPNFSDHDDHDQYTLMPFPQGMRNKKWGFDKHGRLKLAKEERALLPGGKRPPSKKAKAGPVVVSDDEAEVADQFSDCWGWYEADEAEVRAIKHAKLSCHQARKALGQGVQAVHRGIQLKAS
jgi:hypothetical protein